MTAAKFCRETVERYLALVGTATPALVKVKVKFTLQQAMKAQRGSRGIALLFL
jgi:hypothetical protein